VKKHFSSLTRENPVATIEHVLSALNAYGTSNLLIKCDGEVPVLDGSSVEFCSLFEEVGFEDQTGEWHQIVVKEPLRVDAGKASIRLEPCDGFEIDYTLEMIEGLLGQCGADLSHVCAATACVRQPGDGLLQPTESQQLPVVEKIAPGAVIVTNGLTGVEPVCQKVWGSRIARRLFDSERTIACLIHQEA
jgi:hypothetical protein